MPQQVRGKALQFFGAVFVCRNNVFALFLVRFAPDVAEHAWRNVVPHCVFHGFAEKRSWEHVFETVYFMLVRLWGSKLKL